MSLACTRTVHTRIEFPREHVFNFHARIILNGGKTAETRQKNGEKKETLATKTILLLFCYCTANSSSKCGQWTTCNGIDHVAPSPTSTAPCPYHLLPVGTQHTQVSSSSSCRCIAFFSCRCLFSKGYSKLVKRLASSSKK